MRVLWFIAVVSLLPIVAGARIGETPIQCADRYGPPKDTPQDRHGSRQTDLVEGAIHHTYNHQGWKIRVAFLTLDGPAVRMDFQKLSGSRPSTVIEDYELQAIATANTPPGMSWKRVAYNYPDSPNKGLAKMAEGLFAVGQMMWQRSDGAILWSRSNLIVRLELPAAREHEAQLKAAQDRKSRASVPQF